MIARLIHRLAGRPAAAPASPPPWITHAGQDPEINKWVVSRFVADTLVPIVDVHPYPLDELMLMVTATLLARPDRVIEWGTHIGKSARIFHETRERFGLKFEIHSLDLPDEAEHGEHPHEERGRMVRGLPGVFLHQEDALAFARRTIPPGNRGRNLFYVDGDHSFESVSHELLSLHETDPNASILLHDTFFQTPESGYNVGPHRAINERWSLFEKTHRRLETSLGLPGMTLLLPYGV